MYNIPILPVVALFVAAVSSIPACLQLEKRFISRDPYKSCRLEHNDSSGDEVSKEQGRRIFGASPQSTIALLCSAAGVFLSCTSVINVTLHKEEHDRISQCISWLRSATLVGTCLPELKMRLTRSIFCLLQTFTLLLENRCLRRYRLGLLVAVTALSLLVTTASELNDHGPSTFMWNFCGMLRRYPVALQIFLATSVIISSACIPRKVDSVYGKDRESYTSFIGRHTFSWGSDGLKKGRSQASLDLHDLPILHDSMSASHL